MAEISISGYAVIQPEYVDLAVRNGHPRLFLNNNNSTVSEIGTRVTTTHISEYAELTDMVDSYSAATIAGWTGDNGDANRSSVCVPAALMYLLGDGAGYYTKAIVLLDSIGSIATTDKGHYAFWGACIVYDWLYNDLSVSERSTYSAALISYCTSSTYYSQYNTFSNAYHSDRKYIGALFANIGSAIYDDDATSGDEFISRAITAYNRLISVNNEINQDGYIYPTGSHSYSSESGFIPPYSIYGGLKLGGVYGTTINALDSTYLGNTGYGEIYSLIKDGYAIAHNDSYKDASKPYYGYNTSNHPFFSSMNANLYEGETEGKLSNYLQDAYVTRTSTERGFFYLGNILFNNKTANAVGTTITNLPKTKVFDDTYAVYRSGWDALDGEVKETVFHYQAYDQVNFHTHRNRGHFDIWRGYDPLAFHSGEYSAAVNYPSSTSHYVYTADSLAANCMMIRNPGEAVATNYPNDGGQLTDNWDSNDFTVITHTNVGDTCYSGAIKRNSFGDDWFYIYHNYPEAYAAAKVTDLSRIAARVGDYFFIVDRVDGVNASFPKRWLLHSIGAPTIEDSGSWDGGTALDGNGGTPLQTSSDAKHLSMSDGTSKLHLKSLFPSSTTMNRVGGSADYRWYSYNESINYDSYATAGTALGNWRIEIEAGGSNIDDVFLTALYPADSAASLDTVTGISGSNYVGATVADTNTEIVIFSSDVTNALETGYSFTVASSNARRVLCGDLQAGTYSVELDSVEQGPFTVTDGENCLYCTTASGGTGAIVVNRTGA